MDIITASGRIKFLEKRFITGDEISKAVQAKSFNEFTGILVDSYYQLPQNPAKVEELTEFFENITVSILQEMRKILPSEIYNYFILRYDFHNLRLILEKKNHGKE